MKRSKFFEAIYDGLKEACSYENELKQSVICPGKARKYIKQKLKEEKHAQASKSKNKRH